MLSREQDDDELSKPPFLEDGNEIDNDDDVASTSSSAASTSTAAAAAVPSSSSEPPPPPPITRLPEEMISCILAFLPPASVGRASCVCRGWREAGLGYDKAIWRGALARALGSTAAAEAARAALSGSFGSIHAPLPPVSSAAASTEEEAQKQKQESLLPTWRQTFLATPAPRCDGFYVSRESYIRTGLTEWTVRNPVHVVVYFRYYRFFPPEQQEAEEEKEAVEGEEGATTAATETTSENASASAPPPKPASSSSSSSLKPPKGRFWYRTTPDPPIKAARSLAMGPPHHHSNSSSSSSVNDNKNTVVEGRYRLGGGSVGKRVDRAMLRTAWRVRNSAGTEVRAKLKLRSSKDKEGAWDRMDVLGLASHDLASGLTLPFMAQNNQAEEEDDGGFPSATVRRGGGRQQQQQHQAPRAPPPLAHKRGLSTFVFIPWNAVEDSPLNLPLSQMDCWIPG